MNILLRLYRILLQGLCIPVFLSEFFEKETGSAYGLSFTAKCTLVVQMIRSNMRIVSGSTFLEHIAMATTLLKLPKSLDGVVVECGTYKGVSAANISLVCRIVGRRLIIFDSFQGLPEPSEQDKEHTLLGAKEIHSYAKGQWSGSLDEVKHNIAQYGVLEVCDFHQGYFDQTLPDFHQKCVQVWVDVDYRSSLETCLRYLWPLLQDGCTFYTHEAGHMEIAALFFSESWWQANLKTTPPGLVGAGTGIGFKILSGSYFNSSLGFTIKNPTLKNFRTVPQEGGMKLDWNASLKLTEGAPHHS
ncbi:MAG: class I SAM-dependent methyltransferase [Candidatus Omnitrophica bacterium]|nr:class I SAM-dependent methyltransferase [Candidatus Omnitrophota bacterium]